MNLQKIFGGLGMAVLLLACNMTSTTTSSSTLVPAAATEIPPGEEPFVRMISPTAPDGGAVLVNVRGFAVAGEERGSFEGNVVVQALDARGNILDEQATTSTGGEPGEVRQWGAVFSLPESAAGQNGTIYAFFTSARDGSVVAEAQLAVVYTLP